MSQEDENETNPDMIMMTLYGGPHDGEEIEFHPENLKYKPRMSVWFEGKEDEISEYAVDDDGKFVWLENPNDPRFDRGGFVCDEDGNIIAEGIKTTEDSLRILDEMNDPLQSWKFGREREEDEDGS